ncbi:histidine kinase [Gammaproteobacteria bacterium]|nr:histidine kinase [Gammaproteobacteria bacterium]
MKKIMSLSLRIGIIVALIFLLSLVVGAGRALVYAQKHLDSGLEADRKFTALVFDLILAGNEDSEAGSEELLSQLIQLETNYLNIQHDLVIADSAQADVFLLQDIAAPHWFINFVKPENMQPVRIFSQLNGDEISVWINPENEIEAAWGDTRRTMLIRFGSSIFFSLLFFYLVRGWLKPTDVIETVLQDVEEGDYSRRVPTLDLPEFHQIGEKINHLTSALGNSKSENERLTRRSLTIQEKERRYLSQELHDSLGQSISAVKAIAVSIAQRSKELDPVISESANKIEQITDTAYSSVRKMMSSLRPSILDELGLVPALRYMLDDWNENHEDTFARFRIDGNFENLHESQEINVYRIVQEALTNIAKHAKAEYVDIVLSGREVVTLNINDDGQGFEMKSVEKGMGLMGIKERVHTLQGQLAIFSRPRQGVTIQIEFPRVIGNRRRASDDRRNS